MELIIVKRPFRSGNELLNTGGKIVVEDGQGLVDQGYARKLSRDETKMILNEYVQYAENLFSETPEKKTISVNREHKASYQGRLL
jgi:hypothetical protein